MYFPGIMLFGGFLMFLFWVVVILFIIWLVRRSGGHQHMMMHGKDALDIARERYAKGEITEEEFQKIKQNLS
jgi:putative membrane protein